MTSTLRSIDEVVEAIAARLVQGRRTIVGIAGPPGAGKSTIAAQVVAALGPTAAVLPMDGYHYPQADLVERGLRDVMGAPHTFDVKHLESTLTELRLPDPRGSGAVLAPDFDRTIEEPVPDGIRIGPEVTIVVVEGNYLLLRSGEGRWAPVYPLLDAKFYVEVEEGLRQQRLIARHERFGKSPDEARAWALGTDQFNAGIVQTTAAAADYLIALELELPHAHDCR